jgi:small subunit ribosomal protein S27Ae
MRRNYTVENSKIVRNNPFCPRCGEGVFMADKGEWWSCGKCGDRYYKRTFHSPRAVTYGDRE